MLKRWIVRIKPNVVKDVQNRAKTPIEIEKTFFDLLKDLELNGPAIDRPNYRKLKNQGKGIDLRHCHLKKGRPTWVACWEVESENLIIEVYYVGTHEKAPY
jgi:mRNA-degrading endonuclease YafQ of YafQ-DinJ toxin-antitoxin module